ncbi:cation transport ATPase PacS [Candidatus Termititenax persephonae]|uniref:Cation transport ATPase PacS n=1 Tax=Candidatus Termititenax persephonae TaxID=2218525 RepID=A0A388TGN6_9BACT|nr:cation transport ATPase PacS [Candidatus Termititenax persephonae]
MYTKVISSKKDKVLSLAKKVGNVGAVAGAGYAAFIFSLPLLIHYGSGSLGGEVTEALDLLTPNFADLGRDVQKLSLFKINSSGTLGLAHTIGLTLTTFYGAGLIKNAVQKLLLPRYTQEELRAKIPELGNLDQKLFALQTGVTDEALLRQVFDLLERQAVVAPQDGLYTVKTENCTEELRAALFELGLTIGQTDAAMLYLRDTAEKNAELFFRRTMLGAQKLVARAAALPPDKQRLLAREVFQEQLTPERLEAFTDFLRSARRRTFSIDTQIAFSIVLPFFVSMYNFVSGDYISCCPIHEEAIKECLGIPWQNYGGTLPGLAEAAFLAVMHGHISHILEKHAENIARRELDKVMSVSQLAKEYVTLQNGEQTLTPLEDIAPQSLLVLREGQQLPVDAVATRQIKVSEAQMTGEPVPVLKMPGQTVLAGAVSLEDTAQLRVLRSYADSTLAQQEKQIRLAIESKAAAEGVVESFSKWWSPTMSLFSGAYFTYGVLAAKLPVLQSALRVLFEESPKLFGLLSPMGAIKNALTILVATTPCGVHTALPTARLALIWRLAKDRVILRDPKALTAADKTQVIVFDKTDTLTDSSQLSIRGLHYTAHGVPERDLALLYALESLAMHPIAEEIRRYIGELTQSRPFIDNFQNLGKGVQGTYTADGQEHTVVAGLYEYLRDENLLDAAGTADISEDAVVFAVDGQVRLYFEYTETLRTDAADTVLALQKMGQRVVIASGDSHPRVDTAIGLLNAELLARGAAPLTDIHAKLEPEEKTDLIRSLQRNSGGPRQCVAMVGDGNNDSGALAAADFGISWNAKGLARNAAHALVTDGSQLTKVVDILQMSRRYSHNMLQNIFLSTVGNILIIGGVATGYTGLALNYVGNFFNQSVGLTLRTMDMFLSLIMHEGLTFGAALNAVRLMRGRRDRGRRRDKKDKKESPSG